jgi:hypothetical protein
MNASAAHPVSAIDVDANSDDSLPSVVVRRHLRFGWLSLLVFLTLGLVLEALHGFKVQAYLNIMNETRRLMWTLAHAHGTLLALGNLGFAFSTSCTPSWSGRARAVASYALIAASLLMPCGFFLGGIWIYAGDPGLGILLVPLGSVLLFVSVLLTAFSLKHFEIESRVMKKRK